MHTVIVGGGFAGVKAALELSKYKLGKVTLISEHDHFVHHATLYATATGKSYAESIVPLSEIFAGHDNVTIVNDYISGLDPKKHTVRGKTKTYHYDNLILALGSVTTYFGIDGMQQHAFGIKTLEEVKKFNAHIKKEIIEDRKLDRNYVVIGGGPTGVELAGALHNYLEHLTDTHAVDRSRISISLVEAAPRILPRLSKTASRIVTRRLRRMGIEVLTGHMVQSLGKNTITINGKKTPTETAIWTSGVANSPFFAANAEHFNLAPNGRVQVDEHLQAQAHIYVLGDNNTVQFSGQAWPAINQAQYAARHIAKHASGQSLPAFKPAQPPTGVPVGEGWAYVEWHGVYVAGLFGHFVRRRMELYGYKKLLPKKQAIAAWRAHNIPEIDV